MDSNSKLKAEVPKAANFVINGGAMRCQKETGFFKYHVKYMLSMEGINQL